MILIIISEVIVYLFNNTMQNLCEFLNVQKNFKPMNKPIDKIEFKEIGTTQKPHSLQGELAITVLDGMDLTLESVQWLFIEVDGLPLPFRIENIRFRTDTLAIIKLNLVETQEEARKFSNCKILVDKDSIVFEKDDYKPELLVGYNLIDEEIGDIGKILQVDDYNGNLVVTVDYQEQEILIPLNDEFIQSINPESETIIFNCPPGILNLQ